MSDTKQNSDHPISYAELEKKYLSLKQQNRELLKASQYKSAFLANMSHEFRSPLNSMLILSKMLSGNESSHLSDDEVESAKVIHSSGKELLKLIDDILDLSKVEAGKLRIDKRTFSVHNLMDNLASQFKKLAHSDDIQFSMAIADNTPKQIHADDHRIMQILKNLVSNAFKFTQKGAVSVSVGMAQDALLVFSIKDTGIGIPEHKLTDIFEAFQQVDGSISRKYGGTGLGLSISNALAHLLGGRINVTSRPGQGSTFCLELPFEQGGDGWQHQDMVAIVPDKDVLPASSDSEDKIDSEDNDRAIDQVISETKVLLVDDDLRNTFSLSRVLSGKGCQVSIADNGELALEKLSTGDFDIVLLDMVMPVLDGYATAQKIRQHPDLLELPVIALTARAMPEDRQKCLDAGVNDYLAKPVETDKLLGLMKQWLFI